MKRSVQFLPCTNAGAIAWEIHGNFFGPGRGGEGLPFESRKPKWACGKMEGLFIIHVCAYLYCGGRRSAARPGKAAVKVKKL